MLLITLSRVCALLWDAVFFPLLLFAALLLACGTRVLPLRRLPRALALPFSADRDARRAAAVSLGSTVGTGNIVGTSQAIAMGGPGALFWIWLAALAGMLVKYGEILLALRYRKGPRGFGPPDCLAYGLGRAWLARLYAFLALLSAFCMGALVQMNAIAAALASAAERLLPGPVPAGSGFSLAVGLGFAALTLILSLGGAEAVEKAAALLVPLMTLLFAAVSLAVLVRQRRALPGVFSLIVRSAFTPRAALGASSGVTLRSCIGWGLRRSAFSNEAGLGTAAVAHADAAGPPAGHALWGVFEVFMDTLVVCSLTGLCILCAAGPTAYGVFPEGGLYGRALSALLGGQAAALFLALCMVLFAYSSTLSALRFALRCLSFLTGGRGSGAVTLLFPLTVLAGSVLSMQSVWIFADFINVLMAVPNLTALILLRAEINSATREAFS